jgi:ABC-type multidrug transport system fused ATPase/permease subunit
VQAQIKKILYIIGNDIKKLPHMVVFFLLLSFLDVLGIGLIIPYTSVITGGTDSLKHFAFLFDHFDIQLNRENLILFLSLALLIIFVIKAILAIWINRILIFFTGSQQAKVRSKLMSSYQSLPYDLYSSRNSAEYTRNIINTSGHFSGGVLLPLLRIVSDGIIVLSIIVFLVLQAPFAMLILVSTLGFSTYIYDVFFRHRLRQYGERSNKSLAKIVKFVNEGIGGLKEVRISQKEDFFLKHVSHLAENYAQNNSTSQIITSAPRYLIEAFVVAFLVIFVIVYQWIGTDLKSIIPIISMFGVASIRLVPMVNSISSSILSLRYYHDSVSVIYDDLKNVDTYRSSKLISIPKFSNIKFNNVDFAYPESLKKSLENINLKITSGQMVGIVGSSGSGKTTLINLMLGLLKPTNGEITINGNLLDESLHSWWSNVSFIPQNPIILDDSLRNNIALGVSDDLICNKKIIKAVKKAKLKSYVDESPFGIETILGEKGIRISGGQLQRVALARAFYKESTVLVMDEPTSALDSQTETEIVEQLKELRNKITIILISHSESTLKHCEQIYRIENTNLV